MATTSISQMNTAATVDNGDLFEIAHPDQNSATGYTSNKQSLAAIADHMATAVNYPTMNTTAKTIVGAINELEAGGGGGGSSTLAGLTDVAISSPTNGQALVYDSANSKWKNGQETHKYSLTEHIVGEWIDGSTIYEKTYDTGQLPNNDSKDVAHGISNLGLVINLFGFAVRPVDNTKLTLPHVNNAALNNQIQVMVVGSDIRITTKIDRTNFTISYITMQYTKTQA